MALQPAAVAQKERKWMVDKRTKRAVRVNVTQQPATVSTIDRESFRDILFDSSMVYSQERVDHSIDYVTSRAPLIGGKLYSGIEMLYSGLQMLYFSLMCNLCILTQLGLFPASFRGN